MLIVNILDLDTLKKMLENGLDINKIKINQHYNTFKKIIDDRNWRINDILQPYLYNDVLTIINSYQSL
jgi:hypothetical protein